METFESLQCFCQLLLPCLRETGRGSSGSRMLRALDRVSWAESALKQTANPLRVLKLQTPCSALQVLIQQWIAPVSDLLRLKLLTCSEHFKGASYLGSFSNIELVQLQYMQHATCMQIPKKHDRLIDTLASQLWPAFYVYIYINITIHLCHCISLRAYLCPVILAVVHGSGRFCRSPVPGLPANRLLQSAVVWSERKPCRGSACVRGN